MQPLQQTVKGDEACAPLKDAIVELPRAVTDHHRLAQEPMGADRTPQRPLVADLRADAVGAAMTRTGVVHRDPVGRFQASAQHRAALRQKLVLPVDEPAHELALGDADADCLKQRDQALDRHLTLVILHQHKAA